MSSHDELSTHEIYFVVASVLVTSATVLILYKADFRPWGEDSFPRWVKLSIYVVLLLASFIWFMLECDDLKEIIDKLAHRVNNVPRQLHDCANVHDPLQAYNIRRTLDISIESVQIIAGVALGIVGILHVYFLAYYDGRTKDRLWCSLITIIPMLIVGMLVLELVDLVQDSQTAMAATDGVVFKIVSNCTDLSWADIIIFADPAINQKCAEDIGTYACHLRDAIKTFVDHDTLLYESSTMLYAYAAFLGSVGLLFSIARPTVSVKSSPSYEMVPAASHW